MTLYQKYRPTSFEEMIGNEVAIESLQKALKKSNHSHVYLLSGPPGTGKTTIARIMAKELGADDLDIHEVNTASSRGIDTAREISDRIRYNSNGTNMIYILDECHKFTNDMQNALLKPLEDTPEHVYFFLCTTDPQKLIKAIKSRCTEIRMNTLTVIELYKLLKRTMKLEEEQLSKETLMVIAEKSEGSPRKALVALERVLAVESEESRLKFAQSFLYDETDSDIINLCRMLLDTRTSWSDVAKLLKTLKENNKLEEPESVRYAVLNYANSVLLNSSKVNTRAATMLEAFSEPTYNTGKAGITLACIGTIL